MDEYDTPIISGYISGFYDEVVDLMRGLIGGPLKDCEHVEKAVVTGILRVAREALFSGLNNPIIAGVLSREFANKFGFTESELEKMLAEMGATDRLPEIRKWYNGYLFGETVIYNPWSILNFMLHQYDGCRPYWVNTSSVDLIRALIEKGSPKLHSELELIIKGESVEKLLDEHTALRDLDKNENMLWSLLLHSGYLTPTEQRVESDRIFYKLVVPNREVAIFYEDVVTLWIQDRFGDDRMEAMLQALTAGDIEEFGEQLGDLTANVLSYHDLGQRPERTYHAFVLGMLVHLGNGYIVESNRESGFGRYDVMVIPRDVSKLGLALEFKKFYPKKDATMEAATQNALSQIAEKNYAARLRAAGVQRVLGVGIVFQGKEVATNSREL